MKVVNTRDPEKKSFAGPLFTGPDVTLQKLLPESQEYDFNVVNFGKGVRNVLHIHDCEQVLVVTAGKGIVATESERRVVNPGDVIFIPAGEKHWHGAAEDSTFSHIYVSKKGIACHIVGS
ncbi:MAG TPA: cupin domain-containing protein [Planctomycetota bacterium]|nr:cupin domain-containing protein [Planctomycetota bacterium]